MSLKNKSETLNEIQRLKGQTLTEYLILVALIGIGSIGILRVLGQNIRNRLAVISDRVVGKENNSTGRLSRASDYRIQDLDDFQKANDP